MATSGENVLRICDLLKDINVEELNETELMLLIYLLNTTKTKTNAEWKYRHPFAWFSYWTR
jgi:hypothetical protein